MENSFKLEEKNCVLTYNETNKKEFKLTCDDFKIILPLKSTYGELLKKLRKKGEIDEYFIIEGHWSPYFSGPFIPPWNLRLRSSHKLRFDFNMKIRYYIDLKQIKFPISYIEMIFPHENPRPLLVLSQSAFWNIEDIRTYAKKLPSVKSFYLEKDNLYNVLRSLKFHLFPILLSIPEIADDVNKRLSDFRNCRYSYSDWAKYIPRMIKYFDCQRQVIDNQTFILVPLGKTWFPTLYKSLKIELYFYSSKTTKVTLY